MFAFSFQFWLPSYNQACVISCHMPCLPLGTALKMRVFLASPRCACRESSFFDRKFFFKVVASPTVCTVSGGFTQRIRSAKTGSPSHPLSPIPSPLGHVASAQFCIHVFSVFLYFLFLLFLLSNVSYRRPLWLCGYCTQKDFTYLILI